MAYCAICGRDHDTGVTCLDGTQELLKDVGADSRPRLSEEEFKRVSKQADKWFLKVLVWAFVIIAALLIVAFLARKTY
jgi:hypothetical protein